MINAAGEIQSSKFGGNSDLTLPSVQVFTVKKDVDADKEEIINAWEDFMASKESAITPYSSYPRSLNGDEWDEYRGGRLRVNFRDDTSAETPFLGAPIATVFYSGSSMALWNGTDPYYIDKITLTDSVTVNGLSMSASVTPSGASVSGAFNATTITMSDSRNQAWMLGHFYNNIQVRGLPTSVEKNSQAAFEIGGITRYVNAYDYARF